MCESWNGAIRHAAIYNDRLNKIDAIDERSVRAVHHVETWRCSKI
jgi:hypothetical protein